MKLDRQGECSWACSSGWLERTPDKREVAGSTPAKPTWDLRLMIYE